METRRVGVIVPSLNVVIEDDLRRFLPPDVRYHIARGRFKKENGRVTPNSLLGLAAEAPEIAATLHDAGMDAIAFNCTGSSVAGGPATSARIVEQIEQQTGKPATTTILSVTRALRALGIKRLVLITPFPAKFSEGEADYLRQAGFDVLAIAGMGRADADARAAALLSADAVYDFALKTDRPDADGLFLSCANTPTLEAIAPLEKKLGKPVTSSNQAVIWDLLRMVGRPAAGDAPGRLFRQTEPAAA